MSGSLMLETHNNATVNTHTERCLIMWCFYRTGPSDVPGLESRAPPLPCTDPRLPRRAHPPHGTDRASNSTDTESLTFFFPFVFLFLTSGTARGARAVHARPPPLTRAPHTSRTRLTRTRTRSTSEESHHHTHTNNASLPAKNRYLCRKGY